MTKEDFPTNQPDATESPVETWIKSLWEREALPEQHKGETQNA